MALEPYSIYSPQDFNSVSTLLDLVIASHPEEIRSYLDQNGYVANIPQEMKLDLLELIDSKGQGVIQEILPYIPFYDLIQEQTMQSTDITSTEITSKSPQYVNPEPVKSSNPFDISYLMAGQINIFQLLIILMIVYILIKIIKGDKE